MSKEIVYAILNIEVIMKKTTIFIISLFLININFVYAKETVKYAACVDGDTIKVFINNEEKTVRLLAIDTPESVKPDTLVEYYGKEASEYTCNKIKKAKKIELEYDKNSDKLDKYDRILAWVFIDGKLLQTYLVTNGYAEVAYLYNDYKYTDILKEKQELASAKGLGIWNTTAKEEYNKTLTTNISNIDEDYSNIEVVIITCLFLLFVFLSKTVIKKK